MSTQTSLSQAEKLIENAEHKAQEMKHDAKAAMDEKIEHLEEKVSEVFSVYLLHSTTTSLAGQRDGNTQGRSDSRCHRINDRWYRKERGIR